MPGLPPTADTLTEHVEFVRALARAALHGDTECDDVAQDVLAAALRGPARAPEHQRSWLARVLHHRVIDLMRGRARRHAREREAARPEASAPAGDLVERAETGRRLVAAVLALDEPVRAAVLMRFYEDLPPRTIAARLGVPVETVRTRVKRGLALLRARMAERGGSGGRAWSAALLPLAQGRSGGASALLVPGGLLMKKATAALIVLLLGLAGYGAIRLSDLTQEVEELRRQQGAPLAASRAEPSLLSAAAEGAAPMLEGPPAPADMARIDRLERALEGLLARVDQREADWRGIQDLVAEVLRARIGANETAVVASSRNVISAAAQMQQSARVDEDQDRTGEYAGYLEMSGGAAGRMPRVLVPPVLASAFRTLTANGEVLRGGYLYRIYLPDRRGAGVGEPPTGFAPGDVDPDLAETTWCMYAWPEQHGKTGLRTFFTNQGGDVFATEAAYSGSGRGPASDAAFMPTHRGAITGAVANGTSGVDGNVWKQVN
jgi:RNA polymerase sigma-70 factor (ECF subfamily)